jgi:transglutaminase-like putative cysteine protease
VEVFIPGQTWVALDPTNNRWCGEQHIAVSFGRDARDAAPIRGTFKGGGRQTLKVRVKVKRLRDPARITSRSPSSPMTDPNRTNQTKKHFQVD